MWLETSCLPDNLRVYLELLLEVIFELPVRQDDGSVWSHEEVSHTSSALLHFHMPAPHSICSTATRGCSSLHTHASTAPTHPSLVTLLLVAAGGAVPVVGHGALLQRPGHGPLQLLLRGLGPGRLAHTQGKPSLLSILRTTTSYHTPHLDPSPTIHCLPD